MPIAIVCLRETDTPKMIGTCSARNGTWWPLYLTTSLGQHGMDEIDIKATILEIEEKGID